MHKYELVAIGLDPDDPFRFESSLSSNISSFKIENLLDGMNYEIKLNAIPISKSINSPPNIVAVEAMTEYAPPILKTKYVGIDTFIFGWEAPRVPNLSLALRYMSFDSQGSTDRQVRVPTGPNRSEIFKILLALVRSGPRF